MEIKQVEIPGLLVIQPNVFYDNRGYFFESYNKPKLKELGFEANFIQDNQSMSSKGTLRGMHFQCPPFEQGKLITVIKGAVMDVVIDIRKKSPFFGKYFSIRLDDQNKTMFWIPPGFAHGFLTLEDQTIFAYKCTQVYNKASEGSIFWNDTEIKIEWGIENPVISEKDSIAPLLKEITSPF